MVYAGKKRQASVDGTLYRQPAYRWVGQKEEE